jgi:hypothetical protein
MPEVPLVAGMSFGAAEIELDSWPIFSYTKNNKIKSTDSADTISNLDNITMSRWKVENNRIIVFRSHKVTILMLSQHHCARNGLCSHIRAQTTTTCLLFFAKNLLHLAGNDATLQAIPIIVQLPGTPYTGNALKHSIVDKQRFVLHKRQMITRIGVAIEADPNVKMIAWFVLDLIEF